MSRWLAACVSTALLHGALGLLLGVMPTGRLVYVPRVSRPIEVAVRARAPQPQPAPQPPPALDPVAPPLDPVAPPSVPRSAPPQPVLASAGLRRSAPAPAATTEPGPPSAPQAPAPSPGPGSAVPRGVDLFARGSLCRAVGCDGVPRAGDAGSGPQDATGAGVRGALAQDADEADVRAGRVDPQWRVAERDAQKLFAPPIETVAPDSRPSLTVKQLLRPVTPAPANSKWSAWASNDPANRLRDQITAAQDAYDAPAVGRSVQVEIEIDVDGQIVASRVVLGSGSRRLDAAALRAVERAVRLRTIRDPRGPVIARFALRADLAMNLPLPTPAVEPNTGKMSAMTFGISGTFDEVTGKASVKLPFDKRMSTRVDLLSVRRRDAVDPAASDGRPR